MPQDKYKKLLETPLEELPVPVWVTVAGITIAVGLAAWALAEQVSWLSPLGAPFILVLIAFAGFGFIYRKQSDTLRKAYKSWFDVAWNFWTIVGTAYLFYEQIEQQGQGLAAALASLDPGMLSLVFAFAFSSAVGRLMISTCDACWPVKSAQK